MTQRMIPKNGATVTGWAGPPDQSAASARRYYTANAGGVVDVPDLDAQAIASFGFIAVGGSGATSARPTGAGPGYPFVDTTLNLVVVWNGAAWVNPVTGTNA